MLTAVQVNAAITATGAAETAAQIRNVGTEARGTAGHLSLMKRFMGSFLGQQLIFGLISKAIAEISVQVKDVFTKTNEWDAATTQLNAVLASTHHAAGMTADQLIALANSLSTTTTFNNAAVLSAENLILTFTSISEDILPQTTVAVLDMATALKEDTKSAAIQLGKALQDPILGVTALRRVGVNFSKDNQEMLKQWVETGQTARAQAFILAEITREFGGSASAAAGTFAGKLQVLQNRFDTTKEAIGNALIPELSKLFTIIGPGVTQFGTNLPNAIHATGVFLRTYVQQPAIDVKNIVGDLFAALGTLIGGFDSVTGKSNDLGNASHGAHQALKAVGDFIKGQLTPLMKPAGEAVGHVVTALLGFTKWARDNKPVLIWVASFVGVLMVNSLRQMAIAAWAAVPPWVALNLPILLVAAAIAAIITIFVLLVTHGAEVRAFFGHIGDAIGNVLGWLGRLKDTLGGKIGDAFSAFGTVVHKAWDGITNTIKGAINTIITDINTFIDLIDRIQIHIPSIGIGPAKTPAFDWNGLGIPDIPKLAKGGVVGFGDFIAGEGGRPEQISVGPHGAMVTPLGTQHLTARHGGGGGDTHIHVHAPASFLTPQQLTIAVKRAQMLTRGLMGYGK